MYISYHVFNGYSPPKPKQTIMLTQTHIHFS